jgi:hypothetical protein
MSECHGEKMQERQRHQTTLLLIVLVFCSWIVLTFSGCGETAKPAAASSSSSSVSSYFGGPFAVAGTSLARSTSTFDHSANQIGVSSFVSTGTAQVPTATMNGSFITAGTGFLKITEDFATTSSGVIGAQNPPLTGAWAVEIPGAGALANLLRVNSSTPGSASVAAAPAAFADNTTCPNFVNGAAAFWYVTVPNASNVNDTADYGGVNITTQGSAVSFHAQPFLVGPIQQPASVVTGGCSNTPLGALTAYPLNSFGTASNLELISIGSSGLLVSSFSAQGSSSPGAFGGGTGVLGVAVPSGPVDVGAVTGAQYNGFIYAPINGVHQSYDITVLASAFGDNAGTSQACSTLQSSLAVNNGNGSGRVPVLPSPNSLYGGEFLTTTSSGAVNDPTGASSSENCDVVIDLGTQDPANNGVFPNATIFIGSNYPPYSASNPWVCAGGTSACAVSFPATAIVGNVQNKHVIFVAASAGSSPPARLPDSLGSAVAQPVGIYLFQK